VKEYEEEAVEREAEQADTEKVSFPELHYALIVGG
jgi:hypothetical protein